MTLTEVDGRPGFGFPQPRHSGSGRVSDPTTSPPLGDISRTSVINLTVATVEEAMCLQACCALHALWGTLYTAGGSIQMVAGIVFLLALPNFKFGSNIVTGIVNVLLGVVTIMISCLGGLNRRRCHKLLAISIIILSVNVVNLVVLEIGEWYYFLSDSMRQTINESAQMKELAIYARLSTSLTTAALIVIAFIDSQLTFCSMEYFRKPKCRYSYNHETDIEYVIPRDKGNGTASKNSSFHHCTQAWVFDAENGTPSETDSPYQKVTPSAPMASESESRLSANKPPEYGFKDVPETSDEVVTHCHELSSCDASCREHAACRDSSCHSAPSKCGSAEKASKRGSDSRESFRKSCSKYSPQYSTVTMRFNEDRCDRNRRLTPPTLRDNAGVVTVRVNSAAEDGIEVDRQLNHMKTFNRTVARGASVSHQSSFSSIPPIYECLERLTQPKVYMSRLDVYRAENEDLPRPASASSDGPGRPGSDAGENANYAALVAELEKTLDKKKDSRTGSSSALSRADAEQAERSRLDAQRGSDAAFSKELEAALKLIQDLESPNTIDTPSDTCTLVEDAIAKLRKSRNGEDDDTGSEKTLSGSASPDGKVQSKFPVESQSTSGFNSLSHDRSDLATPNPGFASGEDSASGDSGLACVIRHMGDTAVISLFSPSKEPHPYDPAGRTDDGREKPFPKWKTAERDEKTAKSRLAKWRHLIDRKRRTSLLPEVESAIIKSECLAFLSDNELEDRLNQTKSIHRQIEAKVHRQRSFRRADSFGSVEDMLDHFCTTTRL